MGKANFHKVEKALAEGLDQMGVQRLLRLADEAQGRKGQGEEDLQEAPRRVFRKLVHHLTWLAKSDREIYSRLGTSQEEIKSLEDLSNDVEKEANLEKWIEKLQGEVAQFLKKSKEELSDEERVQQERKRHQTKRINVNEKWLPLD